RDGVGAEQIPGPQLEEIRERAIGARPERSARDAFRKPGDCNDGKKSHPFASTPVFDIAESGARYAGSALGGKPRLPLWPISEIENHNVQNSGCEKSRRDERCRESAVVEGVTGGKQAVVASVLRAFEP